MKCRLRNRIRKPQPLSATRSSQNSQTNGGQTLKLKHPHHRPFGQPIHVDLNKPTSGSGTSSTLTKLKMNALEKKRRRRVRNSCPKQSSDIQNIDSSNLQTVSIQHQSKDLVNRIPISCQHVNDYWADICKYLYVKDQKAQIMGDIFADQVEVSSRMRITLVDWLHKIHYKFRLKPETLFRCLLILDTFTKSSQILHKRNYQLVGITCLYIACKFEQIYPPSNETFVEVSGKLYTFQNIVEMEGVILKETEFNINASTSQTHLQRLMLMAGMNQKQAEMARYLNELSMYSVKFYEYSPLTIAGSILLFINKLSKIEQNNLENIDLDWEKAVGCCSELQFSARNPPKSSDLSVLQIKYPNQLNSLQQLLTQI